MPAPQGTFPARSPVPPRRGSGRAGRAAHIRRAQRGLPGEEAAAAVAAGPGGAVMEMGWLLWGTAVLLLLHVLMELSPTVNFVLRVSFYCVLCLLASALAAVACLLLNGGRTVKNMR